jgi:hypothetical protein
MESEQKRASAKRSWAVPASIIGVVVVVTVFLVSLTLRRAPLETYAPTEARPVDVGDGVVGPVTFTIDASNTDRWAAFDFSRGIVVLADRSSDWDIAFRRFNVVTNGGAGFSGSGAVADLGAVAFDSVFRAPADGWIESEAGRDSTNAAIERWYDYGFTSHILRSKRNVYAIRTADGRYAKLQILSYYCPGAVPGCVTFRYVYRGDGSPDVATPAGPSGGPAG